MFRELVPLRTRVLGAEHPHTLTELGPLVRTPWCPDQGAKLSSGDRVVMATRAAVSSVSR